MDWQNFIGLVGEFGAPRPALDEPDFIFDEVFDRAATLQRENALLKQSAGSLLVWNVALVGAWLVSLIYWLLILVV